MRSAVVLGAQMAVNGIAGYAFQKVFAYYYGASVEKSMFDIAFSVPTMIVYLSGIGQGYAVTVSLFSRLREERPASLDRVFSTVMNLSAALLALIVVVAALFAGGAARVFAPGFDGSEQAALRTVILWMLPLTITFGLSSQLSAVALAWRLPIGQEILLLIGRLVVIVAIIANGAALSLSAVGAILVVSTLVALGIQWALLRRFTRVRYSPTWDLRDESVRASMKQLGGLLLVSVAAQAAAIYSRRMGTIAGPAVVALIGFAYSLVDAAASILGKTLSFQVGQPLAAKLRAQGAEGAGAEIRKALFLTLASGAMVAAGLALLAGPVVHLLFGGGQFDAEAVASTAAYLRVLALGLPAAIIIWVCLYPLLETARHAAAMTYLIGYGVQMVFLAILFGRLGGAAIAWGYCLCFWAQAITGFTFLWMSKARGRNVSADGVG